MKIDLKKKIIVLGSLFAFLCLFTNHSIISLLLFVLLFLVGMAVVISDIFPLQKVSNNFINFISIVLTIVIEYFGYNSFTKAWSLSGKVSIIARWLNVDVELIISIIALVLCVAGIYSLYIIILNIMIYLLKIISDILVVKNREELLKNLKNNIFFTISLLSFYSLFWSPKIEFLFSLLFSFVASIILSTQIDSFRNHLSNLNWKIKLISLFSSIGTCYFGYCSSTLNIGEFMQLSRLINGLLFIFSIYSIWICVSYFFEKLFKVLIKEELFGDVTIPELIVYIILIAVTFIFIFIAFNNTDAFYATEYPYDIVYTSDSPKLIKSNVWLNLFDGQNDLRQPLFAVFSAPIVGMLYLIITIFDFSLLYNVIIFDYFQVLLLMFSCFLIAKTMKLNGINRVCFILFMASSYTYMLFSVMIEQYIIAFFYVCLSFYSILNNKNSELGIYDATGTLLTSGVFLFASNFNFGNIKEWFNNGIKHALKLVFLIILFCRFEIFINLLSDVQFLSRFTGKTVDFLDQVLQFFQFVANCFCISNAGVSITKIDYLVEFQSWRLLDINYLNIFGVVLMALTLVSAILNRANKTSIFSFGWVMYSVVILMLLGWGTKENGLILYSLYFGWAYFVLLFQLIEKVSIYLKNKYIVPVLSGILILFMLVNNLPEVVAMVEFFIKTYPA